MFNQASKLSGLRKLKKITPLVKGCSHLHFRHITPKNFEKQNWEEHFRHLKTGEKMPRVLIRTDTPNDFQPRSEWIVQPRIDLLHPDFMTDEQIENHNAFVNNKISEFGNKPKWFTIDRQKKQEFLDNFRNLVKSYLDEGSHVIIHPVRKRSEIYIGGRVEVNEDSVTIIVNMPNEMQNIHRNVTNEFTFVFDRKTGEIRFTSSRPKGEVPKEKQELFDHAEKIVERLKEFLKIADQDGVGDLAGKKFETSFVTYKDSPAELEFYDLLQECPESSKK